MQKILIAFLVCLIIISIKAYSQRSVYSMEKMEGTISFPKNSLNGLMDVVITNFDGEKQISSALIEKDDIFFVISYSVEELIPVEDKNFQIALMHQDGTRFIFYDYERDGATKNGEDIPVSNGCGVTYLMLTGTCEKVRCRVDIYTFDAHKGENIE